MTDSFSWAGVKVFFLLQPAFDVIFSAFDVIKDSLYLL